MDDNTIHKIKKMRLSEKEVISQATVIIDEIKNWDCCDVRELRYRFQELEELAEYSRRNCFEELTLSNHIKLDSLPTEKKYKNFDIDNIPYMTVWAMDKRGDCLVGDMLDSIENIESIYKKCERLSWI